MCAFHPDLETLTEAVAAYAILLSKASVTVIASCHKDDSRTNGVDCFCISAANSVVLDSGFSLAALRYQTAIRRWAIMLDHLLRAFLLVWIEFGFDEDWGIMCYPPVKNRPVRR